MGETYTKQIYGVNSGRRCQTSLVLSHHTECGVVRIPYVAQWNAMHMATHSV